MVFTSQGGVDKRAKPILSQIAEAGAEVEETDAQSVKADMLKRISLCIHRHVARAIARRSNPFRQKPPGARVLQAAAAGSLLEEEDAEVNPAAWQ